MLGAFLFVEGTLCWRRWELQQTRWERPLFLACIRRPTGVGGGGRGRVLSGRPPLQCRSWEVSRIGATFPPIHQALGPPQWPFSELVMGGGPRAKVKGGGSQSLLHEVRSF